MTEPIVKAAILGLIQGLTEFLPISSSGHLVVFQRLLGVDSPGVTLEVVLHLGTLGAVFALYGGALAKDLFSLFDAAIDVVAGRCRVLEIGSRQHAREAVLLLAASVPAAVAGLALKVFIEAAFEPAVAGAGFAITGLMLWFTPVRGGSHRRPRIAESEKMGVKQAFIIGLSQAAAILPGVSRSGATVSTAVRCGLKPDDAARFSFLLSVPAVLGAAAVDLLQGGLGSLEGDSWSLAVGALVAAFSGAAAIKSFIAALKRGRVRAFAVYCWGLSLLTLLFLR